MEIDYLSVSRKQCYDTCEQQYKYKYHLKVVPDKPQQIFFTYGQVIHKAAELYVGAKGSQPLEHFVKEVLTGKISLDRFKPAEKISLPTSYHNKITTHIKHLKNLTDFLGFDGDTEFEFKHDLDPPNNFIIKGYIDRLIKKDDKFFVIDYKTTKTGPFRKDKSSIKKDLQMQAYSLVIREKFNIEGDKIILALFYLEDGKMVSVSFNDETLDQCKKYLIKSFQEIKNKNPDKVNPNVGSHCRFCDYNDICPYYKNKT
jgi:CRISPR/Cas system-associated exonuclease Cas4 (RecB family)